MGHDHAHGVSNRRRLITVLFLTIGVALIQAIVAAYSSSLALFADAGHMLGDAFGIVLALTAMTVARHPLQPDSTSTYGHLRTEILAAGLNGLVLLGVSVTVFVSAIGRIANPVDIAPVPVMLAAAVGLAVNIIGMLILRVGARHSLNVRGAYLEVMGDALGSVAVLVSAVVIQLTGWLYADPIASLVIAAMIAPRAVSLLTDVGSVLMERTPKGMDLAGVREHMLGVEGVLDVHDLHVWEITSGVPVMSAHVTVDDNVEQMDDIHRILDGLTHCLREHFDVEHSTFQIEPEGHRDIEDHVHS